MMKRLFLLICAALWPVFANAQEDPVHNELRKLRDGLLEAMNRGDIEGQLAFLHPNVIVTWHNAEVSRGRDGVRAYLNRMLTGPSKIVEKFGATVKVDELSIIYGGDTALAYGSAQEHFQLTHGGAFDFTGRWSATMVKEGDHWLIANLHSSDNIFDNPVANRVKSMVQWIAGGSLGLGLLFGWLIGRRKRVA
jgi:ketosteroid isomerase-like protein